MDAIFERHSVRSFDDRTVADDIIEKIVSAGCAAPSSKNDQPWRIIIAKQPRLSELACRFKDAAKGIRSDAVRKDCEATFSIMGAAPVCIFVFLDADPSEPRYPAHVQSLGAFVENMALEAQHLGLGTLWCGDILEIQECTGKIFGTDHAPETALLLGYESGSGHRKRHKVPGDMIIRGYDEW